MNLCRAVLLSQLLLAGPALAEGPSGTLLDLAGRVPLAALASEPGAFIHFADLAAARRAAQDDPDPLAPWARVGAPPMSNSLLAGFDGAWEARVGFGPDDIGAALTIQAPPRRGHVLSLDPAAAGRVGPALLAAGHEAATMDGVEALARGGEDRSISLADRDPANPLGGELGMASRAMVQGSDLIWSNEWPLLLDLAREPAPDPRLAALAAAIDLPDWNGAELTQAVFWLSPLDFVAAVPPGLLELDPSQQEAALEELLAGQAGGLPPWSLALLADMGRPDAALTLVLFVYQDLDPAKEAAKRLAESFPQARSALVADRTLAELTRATATTQVTGDGPYVAVLALHGAAEDDGHAFRVLLQAWHNRDLALFGPG